MEFHILLPINIMVQLNANIDIQNGLAFLANASLPLKFWMRLFLFQFFLMNCLPTTLLSLKSPLEALFLIKSNFPSLKVFGCACYPNVRAFNKHKLQFRTTKCTFIGYSLIHKGYVWFPESTKERKKILRKMIFSCLVVL